MLQMYLRNREIFLKNFFKFFPFSFKSLGKILDNFLIKKWDNSEPANSFNRILIGKYPVKNFRMIMVTKKKFYISKNPLGAQLTLTS